jgi:hypothetical protein
MCLVYTTDDLLKASPSKNYRALYETEKLTTKISSIPSGNLQFKGNTVPFWAFGHKISN